MQGALLQASDPDAAAKLFQAIRQGVVQPRQFLPMCRQRLFLDKAACDLDAPPTGFLGSRVAPAFHFHNRQIVSGREDAAVCRYIEVLAQTQNADSDNELPGRECTWNRRLSDSTGDG